MASLCQIVSEYLVKDCGVDPTVADAKAMKMFEVVRAGDFDFEYVPDRDMRAFYKADAFLEKCKRFIDKEYETFKAECENL